MVTGRLTFFGVVAAAPEEAELDRKGLEGAEAAADRKRRGRRFYFSPTPFEEAVMAKSATVKIKLVSSADTGFYYVTKKNSRTKTDKLSMKKYDPVVRKHVEFKEAKIK